MWEKGVRIYDTLGVSNNFPNATFKSIVNISLIMNIQIINKNDPIKLFLT